MRGRRLSSPLEAQHVLVTVLVLLSLATTSVVRCLLLQKDLQSFVSTLEQYARTRNDIVFVLDESGSIGEDNFPAERNFAEMTARLVTVSPDFSRLAVVTYGSDNKLHINHISDGGGGMCSFLHELNTIGYRGGGTMTREALKLANSLLQQGRLGVHKIIILISDGRADSGNKPNDFARELKRSGVIIFAVGVASINRAELEEVATSPKHIYMLTSFPYIKERRRGESRCIRSALFDFSRILYVCIRATLLHYVADIHDTQWDKADQSECLKVGRACDTNAICGCGARSGTHQCVCKAGYQGEGTHGKCQRCPRGSYKSKTGSKKCDICPGHSATPDEGATSLDQCSCIAGYEGNPGGNVPCSPIKCAKLSDPPGGSNLPHPCGNTFGSECDFKCTEGHCPYSCNMTEVLAGNLPWNSKSATSRVCQANGQWSGGQFFCDSELALLMHK
nr:sushi, von Willebrand factor type A, EGF and pentraxin domain-containing protein 1-like [Dermacentor andersoni]